MKKQEGWLRYVYWTYCLVYKHRKQIRIAQKKLKLSLPDIEPLTIRFQLLDYFRYLIPQLIKNLTQLKISNNPSKF